MNQEQVNKNIKLFKVFQILSLPLFWGPILISYITNVGKMSLSDLYSMEAIVVSGMIFAEIYSSGWADLLGRKKTIILGSILQVFAFIIFTTASSPLAIWVANIIIMLGSAIISGADEAFLADTLKDAGRFHEFTKINRSINNVIYPMLAISSIASGYLYAINPRLPMILSIPGIVASLISTFFLFEPKSSEKAGHKEHFNLIKMSVLFVANHKKIKWIIGFMALITVVSKIWFFTYNPYFELTALDPKYFGWIFCIINIIAWQANKHSDKIEKKFSDIVIIACLILLISIPIIIMGKIVVQASILLIFLDSMSRGFRGPFFSRWINEHLDSKNRATVLSIQSGAMAVVSAICLWIFGRSLNIFSLSSAMQLLGASTLVVGWLIIWQYKKIFIAK